MKNNRPRFQSLERIGIHKVALIFLEKYGWIEREQPISDFGIDMHIEIVEEGEPTGQLFGLQIKSGQSYLKREKDDAFIFDRGEKRHLEYWISQSIPVLVILYDEVTDEAYWQEVKISRVVETEKGWNMPIPKKNTLTSSKATIEKIYFNPNHFTTVEEYDFSYALARRVSIKFIVENSLSSSRIALRKMIPYFTDKYKDTSYYRNVMVRERFGSQGPDVICLYFYNSVQQFRRGLAFCYTCWNSDSLPDSDLFSVGTPNEQVGGIDVVWNSMAEVFDDHIPEKEISKGEFLDAVDALIAQIKTVTSLIQQSYLVSLRNKDLRITIETILNLKEVINRIQDNELNYSYSPVECQELSDIFGTLTSYVHNFLIVTEDQSRDDGNLKYMYKDYIKQIEQNLKKFSIERQKVS